MWQIPAEAQLAATKYETWEINKCTMVSDETKFSFHPSGGFVYQRKAF